MARRKRRRPKTWRHSVGDKPHTVTVEERSPNDDMLQIRYWDPRTQKYVRKSLGHRDRDEAEKKAAKVYADLRNQDEHDPLAKDITLAKLFAAHKARNTRLKVQRSQPEDERRIEMWIRALKGHIDPHTITPDDMKQFQHSRKRGAIDARGNRVATDRKSVRQRTVELDIIWLKGVLNWGTQNRDREGQIFLRCNPIVDFKPKKEKNPRRPVATQDRYEALLAKADEVEMEVRWNGKREKRRSYFRELLVLCHETGRRITPVCQLRFEDLRLKKTKEAPFGGIVWPEDTDKSDTEYVAPLTPAAREAIDCIRRERPNTSQA